MCGITGFWSSRLAGQPGIESVIDQMTTQLAHRGPDGSGSWLDASQGLALGHRRLSILDVSDAGKQPMTSHSGRFVISYNGETYNFKELRSQLPSNIRWRSDCDVEVLLEGFEHWGIGETISRMNGMFAFALWDSQEQKLRLVRDRAGIKPLYCYQSNGQFAFASELSPFNRLPKFNDELEPAAVRSLVARGHVAAPLCIFKNVKKLEPGCILELSAPDAPPKITTYWSFDSTANESLANRFNGDAVTELDEVLKASVKRRMISDVPLGAFLSGGIDSSLIVSLMQAQSDSPVKTFAIGFKEKKFDESPYARAVAKHLGTDHTELIVGSDDALKILPNMAAYYDEPFADQSLIPTLMVSELARQRVTVSLSGDGGDELFGGYSRYFRLLKRWPRYGKVQHALGNSVGHWWLDSRRTGRAGVARFLGMNNSDNLDRFFRYAATNDLGAFYEQYMEANCIGFVNADLLGRGTGIKPFGSIADQLDSREEIMRLMLIDSSTYLPNDILTKVDRASMRHSLEARVPFLDHEVIAFAFRLNDGHRISNGTGKLILKQLLERYVPRQLFDRQKKGFGVPIADWLRNELRDWAESLLAPDELADAGFFDVESVSKKWKMHLNGTNQWFARLWRVLVFQNWRRAYQQQCRSLSTSTK